jgi:hypothetical protein
MEIEFVEMAVQCIYSVRSNEVKNLEEEEETNDVTVSQPYNAVAAGHRINADANCRHESGLREVAIMSGVFVIISAKATRLVAVSPFELLVFGVGL